jgi:periplasmic divalent cation tolerance protein
MTTSDVVLILTTAPDDEGAETLARTLVEERLAACVNLHGPMVSIYRWKNDVQRDVERQIVIKTTRSRVQAIEARLRQLHSYELPEFLVVPVERGGDAYVDWITQTVG